MGRIVVNQVKGKLIVTKYKTQGTLIPTQILQERIAGTIENNLDENHQPKEEVKEVGVPRLDFLRKTLTYPEAIQRFDIYGRGLYSKGDMFDNITWCEVAYLYYYVLGADKTLDWDNIKPEKGIGVCVLKETDENRTSLVQKLAKYKNEKDMESYLNSLRLGERYIPLPLYCAYIDFINRDDLDYKLGSQDLFKRVTKEEFDNLFED